MRACACLLVCAALALAPRRATAAHPPGDERLERIKSQILAKYPVTNTSLGEQQTTTAAYLPGDDDFEHIKLEILVKLGLTTRPTPQGAPPHDVVRQILARAADPAPREEHHEEHAMREIIAIAQRG